MDLVALPVDKAIKIIKSKNMSYEITSINSASDGDHIERVIRYAVSGNNVILTTAYFKNSVRNNNE
ncbi:MAG: hypothetical protein GX756_03985 [Clostridiales bacterium]|jgi:uncharacterized protein YqgV (UPF0045/DUF77 family)|nr:hypothetical protein [Clostridiales bacterium]